MTDFALYLFCEVEICGAIGPWNLIGYVLVEGKNQGAGHCHALSSPAPRIASIPYISYFLPAHQFGADV